MTLGFVIGESKPTIVTGQTSRSLPIGEYVIINSKEGKIVLNISSSATEGRLITNSSISFKARFSGKPQKIIVPYEAVLTIYAQENGEGMFFDNKLETKGDKNEKPNLTILD